VAHKHTHTKKWHRCVKAVLESSRGKVDPYAVCTASLGKRSLLKRPVIRRNFRQVQVTDPDVKRAVQLFRSFREEAPTDVKTLNLHVPKAVAHIGTCEFVGYVTTHKGHPALYVHYFAPGSRPAMYGNTGRCEVYFLGGRYTLTAGGFTDLNRQGKIVDYKPRFRVFQVDEQGRIIIGKNDRVIRSRSRVS
jgi:hypothetical protein